MLRTVDKAMLDTTVSHEASARSAAFPIAARSVDSSAPWLIALALSCAPHIATAQEIERPLDEVEYVAVGNLDAGGAPRQRTIEVFGERNQSARASARASRAPAAKLSLGAAARAARAQPGSGEINLLVNVPTGVRYPLLPALRVDVPRSHPDNVAILEQRSQVMAAVSRARSAERADLETRIAQLGGTIVEALPVGNSVKVTVPAAFARAMLSELSGRADVSSISLAHEARAATAVAPIRAALKTDPIYMYGYDGDMPGLYMGMIDSGIRHTHDVFAAPGAGQITYLYDCVEGGSSCDGPEAYTGENILHGTSMANIIMGGDWSGPNGAFDLRGVSRVELDSIKVINGASSDEEMVVAMQRAFSRAGHIGDIIITQAAFYEGTDSAIIAPVNAAANDAFDMGIMILTAIGNNDEMSSPGQASKVLGVGAYDASTYQIEPYYPRGRVNGRIKPDLLGPTNVDAAEGFSNFSVAPFGGTSAATAALGGAAAIMYEVYSVLQLGTEPGILYAAMLAGSDNYTPSTSTGAGRFWHQGVCGTWVGGVVTNVSSANRDISIQVPSGRSNIKVAIWWPEEDSEDHRRIALRLYRPNGVQADSSTDSTSVWQVAGQSGAVPAGNWTLRIDPYLVLPQPQTVYFAVQAKCT
jgi:hypothetical protein